MRIWKANPQIVDKLREVGALLHAEKFTHSYMHCWRHKTPIIYRATTQWFAGMDDVPGYNGVKPARDAARDRARAASRRRRSIPAWGKARLLRHDRATGPTGRCRGSGSGACRCRSSSTGRPTRCTRTRWRCSSSPRRRSSTAASRRGSRRRTRTSASTAKHYRKLTDTLDVWFDSGSTHQTVLGGPDGRDDAAPARTRRTPAFPADLYLEGSDQHRGWFHSSLLVSCMLNGVPPYKALLTHGFVVDGEGKKMSKSKGNVVAPQKVSDTLGAEILRLWVAATDYSGELSISDEILKRVVESYRRIRNTLRFLLANTADFDRGAATRCRSPSCSRSTATRSPPRGRWPTRSRADYARYEFHLVVQRLQTYCSEDLGGFYLDVLKDRLYTAGARQPRAPLGADRAGADPRRAARS